MTDAHPARLELRRASRRRRRAVRADRPRAARGAGLRGPGARVPAARRGRDGGCGRPGAVSGPAGGRCPWRAGGRSPGRWPARTRSSRTSRSSRSRWPRSLARPQGVPAAARGTRLGTAAAARLPCVLALRALFMRTVGAAGDAAVPARLGVGRRRRGRRARIRRRRPLPAVSACGAPCGGPSPRRRRRGATARHGSGGSHRRRTRCWPCGPSTTCASGLDATLDVYGAGRSSPSSRGSARRGHG